MGTFQTEVSFDQTGIINTAIDHRRGIDAVIQKDAHLTALVLLRKGPEAPGGFRRESEIHLPHSRVIGVASLYRAPQIPSGNYASRAQHVPAFPAVPSTAATTP